MNKQNVAPVLNRLDESYGKTKELFAFREPWQQLVAIMLSAQTTDRQVSQVLPQLFGRYPSAAEMGKADAAEVMEYIRPVGLHKTKAKHIVACCG